MIISLVFLFVSNVSTVEAATSKELYCECTVQAGFATGPNQIATGVNHDSVVNFFTLPKVITNISGDFKNTYTFPKEQSQGFTAYSGGYQDKQLFGYEQADEALKELETKGLLVNTAKLTDSDLVSLAQKGIPVDRENGDYFFFLSNPQHTKLYPFALGPNDENDSFSEQAYIINETRDTQAKMLDLSRPPICTTPVLLPSAYSGGFVKIPNTNPQTYIQYKMSCTDHLLDYQLPEAHVTTTANNNSGTSNSDLLNSLRPQIQELNKLGVTNVQGLIGKIINALLGILGSIALVMIMYGGLLFMTSSGSADKKKKSIGILVWSTLGIVIIFSSYAVVNFVLDILR